MSQMSQGSQFLATETSFPLLSVDEIVDVLQKLNVYVEKRDIVKPSSNSAYSIYSSLLTISKANVEYEMNEKYGLSQSSLNTMLLVRKCKELWSVCGINDFSAFRLHFPQKETLIRDLSAWINFKRYDGENSVRSEEKIAKSAELATLAAEIANKCDEKSKEVNEAEKEYKGLFKQGQKSIKVFQKLREKSETQHESQNKILTDIKSMEREAKELQTALKAKDIEIMNNKNPMEHLKSKLVASPERLESAANTNEKEREELRRKVIDIKNKLKAESLFKNDLDTVTCGELQVLEKKKTLSENYKTLLRVKHNIKCEKQRMKESKDIERHRERVIKEQEKRNKQLKDHFSENINNVAKIIKTLKTEEKKQITNQVLLNKKIDKRILEEQKVIIQQKNLVQDEQEMKDYMAARKEFFNKENVTLCNGLTQVYEEVMVNLKQ